MNRFALTALAVFTITAPAFAGDYRVGGIEVRRPWTRPAQAGMTGVGYFTLANVGKTAVKLVRVESPVAQSVTLHQTRDQGGVSSMRPVEGGVTLAPGAKVAFAPGGYHLMLMGLTRAQAVGGKAPLTLVFADGRRMKIELSVENGPPKAEAADPMAGMAGPMAGMHDHH
jgi:copper(I)-binding protein